MKKSLLSLVLCVAMIVTAMGTMVAMPASAAEGVDFLLWANAVYGNDATPEDTYTWGDGQFVFNPTAADQEVTMELAEPANLNDYPFFDIEISSTVDFDLCFHDNVSGDKWMFGAGDFCWAFEKNNGAGNPLPAGDHTARIDLTGAYTWNGDPLPANASIITFCVIAKGAGTITVTKAQLTDGMKDVDVNSRGDQSDRAWDNRVSLIQGEYKNHPAPNADDPQSNVTVKQDADGNWIYGNDNGQWPAASYTYATPIVVNDQAAIEMDFTVTQGSNTTIYIFFNQDTPDAYNNGTYMYIADKDDIVATDLSTGNYKGVLFLSDMVKRTIANLDKADECKNSDGKFVITGIKIFGTNNSRVTDEAVIIRKFDLLTVKDGVIVETTAPTTGTTKPSLKPPANITTQPTTEATTQATTEATTAAPTEGTTQGGTEGTTVDTTTAPEGTDTTAAPEGTDTTKATEAGDTTTKATEAGSTEATKAPEGGATEATKAPEGGDSTTAPSTGDTTAPALDGTTAADGAVNTTGANGTTTTNQVQNVGGNSAPTGDVSNATLFLVIAAIAAAVVTFSVASKKVKN